MALIIDKRPIREIVPFNLSKWNAAFSPILYDGNRRDFIVTNIASSGQGDIFVYFTGGTLADTPDVNSFVFLSSGPYKGSFKVLSTSASVLRLDTPFITISSSGYMNFNSSRANYHIELELYKIVNSNYVLIATSVFRTRPDGTFQFDINALLKQDIIFLNKYDYMAINERDTDVSGGFNFRLREVFQGSNNPFSNFDEKDVTYFVGAARQLRDNLGANLGDHVPITGSIGLFNGDFNISDLLLDQWSNVDVLATSVISSGMLLYSSNDDNGISTWTSDTELEDGVDYEIVVDKEFVVLADVTIIAGTNEVTLTSVANREKILITANGVDLKIRFDSIAGGLQRQAQLNSIEVYLTPNPHEAKFLVEDFEPTYFKDFPFDLPFIHSDNIENLEINRNREFFDQNNVSISVSIDPLDVSTNEFAVNRMIVGAVPPNTRCIDVWLTADEAIRTGYVDIGYVGGEGETGYTSGTHQDNPTTNPPPNPPSSIPK